MKTAKDTSFHVMVDLAVSEVVGHSMNVEENAQSLRKQANELNDVVTAARSE